MIYTMMMVASFQLDLNTESVALPIDHLLVSVLGGVLLGTQEKHVLQEAVMPSAQEHTNVTFTSPRHIKCSCL